MEHNLWRLDPSKFPRRLDLDLPPKVLAHLESVSARTGRPLHDIASDLLSQAVADLEKHPD